MDFASVTVDELIACAPRLEVQLTLLLGQTGIWYLFINVGYRLVAAVVNTWDPEMRARWLKLCLATFKKAFFMEFETEEAGFIFSCMFCMIALQHGIGGSLCLPSVLGLLPSVAGSMARHGALCEAGWEMQDYILRWYYLLLKGEGGTVMIVMTLHHAMGLSMVIPMNLYYGENRSYHELVAILQLAASGAICLQMYGFTLDTNTPAGLMKMKAVVYASGALIYLSRAFRYIPVGYNTLQVLSVDGGKMYYVGLIVVVAMGLFNLCLIGDVTGKVIKFATMKPDSKPDSKKPKIDLGAIDEAAADALSAASPFTPGFIPMTKSQKEWAKVRGVYRMHLLTEGKKKM